MRTFHTSPDIKYKRVYDKTLAAATVHNVFTLLV